MSESTDKPNLSLVSKSQALTKKQIFNTFRYVDGIIDNLSDAALNELINGYSGDLDKLLNELLMQTSSVINFNASTLNSEKLEYLEHLEKSFDESLKVMNFAYFTATVLTNFDCWARNLEWMSLVELYPWSAYLCSRGSGKSFQFCYALPLFKLYGYNRPHPLIQEPKENKLRKETCIITNTATLVSLHTQKIVEEIRLNDILTAKLNPHGKANLGKESITTETGSLLHTRSRNSSIRGLHVSTCVTDDYLDKSCLYSREQRDKFLEIFQAEICNIVDQGGTNVVCGTPFHQQDLYSSLRSGGMFKVFTYPGIMPNKEILAPDRFTFPYLMELKKSLGSIVFAREILVSPISDSSTLFPYEILMRGTIGMEHIQYANNIDSFPIKMERVAIGCDFAISGSIGADSSVFAVIGRDKDKNIYLIDYWRGTGISHDKQVSQIVSMNERYKPNVIVMESNGFQKILLEMVKQRGVRNVKEFVTTAGVKRDLYSGLPALAATIERGQLRFPYNQDEDTQNKTELVFSEMNGITFNPDSGKLENSVDHDDTTLAIMMAVTEIREKDKILELFMV